MNSDTLHTDGQTQRIDFRKMTLLDCIRLCGKLRRQQYAIMASYEREQQQEKAATLADEEAEILAEIAEAA